MISDNSIPETIIDKICSINPSKIYMVGGSDVLSDNLKRQLSNITNLDIVRISGNNKILYILKYRKLGMGGKFKENKITDLKTVDINNY